MSHLPKLAIFLSVVVALVLITSCKKSPAPAAQNANASPKAGPQVNHPEGGEAPPVTQTKYFKGSIGSALGLQMKLVRSGEALTGSYFYQNVGTKIDVKGTVDKDGNLSIEEFDSSGKPTGLFKGLWKTGDDGSVNLVGNWSTPNGTKQTAFSLHEEAIEFSGATEIVAKPIKETNKTNNYSIEVEYPQITGAADGRFDKFNQQARALVNRKIAEFKKDVVQRASEDGTPSETSGTGSDLGIGYTVGLANDNLVSVQFEIGGYYQGAAHPNSYSQVINFDVPNGKVLRLADLFKPGAKYLPAMSAYAIKDLKAQSKAANSMLPEDTINSGAGPTEKNFKSWTITRKGLALTFDAYQVGPYVAGPQKVLVPYATLKDFIKPDGPLAVFVK